MWGVIRATVAVQLIILSLGQEEEISLAQQQYEKAMDLRYLIARPVFLSCNCRYDVCIFDSLKIWNAV